MNNVFDISGSDIALLADDDLRSLIGLLCEADYQSENLSTSAVLYGGHQDAPDGGLDVVVKNSVNVPKSGFIGRSPVGIQVKKPKMPRQKIINEMSPKGKLREDICSLIQDEGAYIIVCSSENLSGSMLANRLSGMNEAVRQVKGWEKLHLDFYDQNRIASWVRSYPSMVLWVQRKLGKALAGWRPYENWSNSKGTLDEVYILDETLRLKDCRSNVDRELTILGGFKKLQRILKKPKASVRLTGLSGVGKTRFVQALFDNRISDTFLNPLQVIYADISYDPEPQPIRLAEELVINGARSILVIDNCKPEIHKKLTQICGRYGSKVSLITVEYDIRESLPEETEVFKLEPASGETIEALIKERFKHISQIDKRSIAQFSGGNARIAIAVASTLKDGESLGHLKDDELFERLFWQRGQIQTELLHSAEVLSLVYSFDGEDISPENSELHFLSKLSRKSPGELYEDVNLLSERDLIQARGKMRALLPHAIANRLAERALKRIHRDIILDTMMRAPERLFKSFSRRLGYLHSFEPAVKIVTQWLSKDGLLGQDSGNLSRFGVEILKNVAPVSPQMALECIELAAERDVEETFTSRKNPYYTDYTRLLAQLAYDADLFYRSTKILVKFSLNERPQENVNSIRNILKSLFTIALSGTHATIEARARIISELLESENESENELGLMLVNESLKTGHFTSFNQYDFGSRSRNYGFYPRNREDLVRWYKTFTLILDKFSRSERALEEKAREILAQNFRFLWRIPELEGFLLEIVMKNHDYNFWPKAWVVTRQMLEYETKKMPDEKIDKLKTLEQFLRPKNLLERVHAIVLIKHSYHSYDVDDEITPEKDEERELKRWDEKRDKLEQIGSLVAKDKSVFQVVPLECLKRSEGRDDRNIQYLGAGMAKGAEDPYCMWENILTQFYQEEPQSRSIDLMLGFLRGVSEIDTDLYELILDELLENKVLNEFFPLFQVVKPLNERGLLRLFRSLEIGKAPLYWYQRIGWGRAHETLSDTQLEELLSEILKAGAPYVVIDIISMRYLEYEGKTLPKGLTSLLREALANFDYSNKSKTDLVHAQLSVLDHELKKCAELALNGKSAQATVREVLRKIFIEVSSHNISLYDYDDFLRTMARLQPIVFLDAVWGWNKNQENKGLRISMEDFSLEGSVLDSIPAEAIISWASADPEDRFSYLLKNIDPVRVNGSEPRWHPIAKSVLELSANEPYCETILNSLSLGLHPTSWFGSRADILVNRAKLLGKLIEHPSESIASWAKEENIRIQRAIEKEKEFDSLHRQSSDSFE